MRFDRLRLNGFKSFVDPTDLVIADGLTGVVGPNGCGKSNLLEALRWVMGENRPTAMRGGGMEDVIFAGAASRGARHFAEVSLVIDNGDRLAPAAFNGHDSIEIVRRITRDAGSAFKVAGKDARARDVQMLFADASSGSQSPALVRQGQIAELIAAKPKARRRILEEAAGISGLYQRRHEAELRLKAAEQNLSRIDDGVAALASQLATLDRQARQAQRYREIAEALRRSSGALLVLRWREADRARVEAERVLAGAVAEAAGAEKAARQAAAERQAAEAAQPALAEEESIAQAVLRRAEAARTALNDEASRAAGAARSAATKIAQLDRDAERERSLNADAAGAIEALEAEAGELSSADEGHEDRLAVASGAVTSAEAVMAERETALTEATEEAARLAARHQSADRALSDAGKAEAAAGRGAEEAAGTAERAEAALAEAGAAEARAAEESAAASEAARTAEGALGTAEGALAEATDAEQSGRTARAEAEGALGALKAEHKALKSLVDRDTSAAGSIMDRVTVTPGFEAALGAALGEDLGLPEAGEGTGWRDLPPYDAAADLPAGAVPLSRHVTGPVALSRRLDRVGVVDAAEGAALQPGLSPGQRLVSPEGTVWRWDGLATVAGDSPSAAALRLEQRNRLSALADQMAEAQLAADLAVASHEGALSAVAGARSSEAEARQAVRAADRRLADLAKSTAKAEADRTLAAGRLEGARTAAARHREEAEAAGVRRAEAAAAKSALGDLDVAKAASADVRTTLDAARMTLMTRRAEHDEIVRAGRARADRRRAILKERTGWESRLDSAGARLGDIEARRSKAAADLAAAEAVPGRIADRIETAGHKVAEAGTRAQAAADASAAGDSRRAAAAEAERRAERAAGAAREARARAETGAEAAGQSALSAAERIQEETGAGPDALAESLGEALDDPPSAADLDARIERLKRQRDGLGAVNLRAEEDARAVRDEHGGLLAEKADLEAAIGELRRGIAALNKEGRERMMAAFEEVNANFETLFQSLFGGGEARLELVESDDPLDAGLEILCCPPGKRLSTLTLLSGGEQTLTASALIFAVFLANPAPICVLDEVDAPLDDANVTRFCDMLDEMTRRTQTRFLIITHHAVTMSRMDRLFGVTMAEQGVSQLVSVDLKLAETMVA